MWIILLLGQFPHYDNGCWLTPYSRCCYQLKCISLCLSGLVLYVFMGWEQFICLNPDT